MIYFVKAINKETSTKLLQADTDTRPNFSIADDSTTLPKPITRTLSITQQSDPSSANKCNPSASKTLIDLNKDEQSSAPISRTASKERLFRNRKG